MNSSVSRTEIAAADATGLGKALEPLQLLAERYDIDTSWMQKLAGAPLDTVIKKNHRIPWARFIAIIRRFGEEMKPHGGWSRFDETFSDSTMGDMMAFLGLALSPGLFYRAVWTWIAPHWFPHLISTYHQVGETEFRFTLEIPEPYAYDIGYFEMSKRLVREIPRFCGLPLAEVEMSVDGRRAEFVAFTSRPRTILGRIKHWLSEKFVADRLDDVIRRKRGLMLEKFSTLAHERARLAESNRARQRAIATVRAAVFEIVIDTGNRTVSADFFRLFGAPTDDERRVEEIVLESCHPRDRPAIETMLVKLANGDLDRDVVEFRAIVDGMTRWLRMRVSRNEIETTTIAASFLDVTSTHDAFETAQKSLGRLERVLEVAPFAVVVHRDGIAHFSNPAFKRLADETASAVLGRTEFELDRDAKIISVPTERRERNIHLRVHDTRVDWEGTPCIMSTLEDVTVAQAIVERSMVMDRMAATGTHAAGIAHEINNPLAYIQSNVDFALELFDDARLRGHDVDDILEALGDAKAGTVRVREVVSALKDFSRHATGELNPTDIPDVIHRAVNIVWSEIRERAELVTSYDISRPVMADPVNLIQVLVNLLRNAAAAIPDDDRGRIEIRVAARDGDAIIEILDDGEGIAPDILPRIFDPFFTTRPPGEGAGLGLSLARSRVERMNGRLRLLSNVGTGTLAEIRLPLSTS